MDITHQRAQQLPSMRSKARIKPEEEEKEEEDIDHEVIDHEDIDHEEQVALHLSIMADPDEETLSDEEVVLNIFKPGRILISRPLVQLSHWHLFLSCSFVA